jgi:hypothetical protein
MSNTRGIGRGRGRGRGIKALESPVDDSEFEPSEIAEAPVQAAPITNPRRPKPQQKSIDDLKRIMDIVKSRISVIIDSLEGDDNEAVLKRNVATAVKHLKQIDALLDL